MVKPTADETALKERARKLGYKLRRRGDEFRLIDSEGGVSGGKWDGVSWLLDGIENKQTLQIKTACDTPLFIVKLGQ